MSVYAALLTPFRPDGAVDLKAQVDHARWLAEKGISGLVVFGTTGEGPSLELREKLAALEHLFSENPGLRIVPTLMEGNLPSTLEGIRAINDLPAEKVLILPPYYYKPLAPQGLQAFFQKVLEASRHPVVLYHIPKYAVPVPPELAGLKGVWGVKDSGGEKGYADTVLALGRGVWVGTEENLWEKMHNAQGVVSALANLVPEALILLWRFKETGQEEKGKELDRLLGKIRSQIKAAGSLATLKRLAEIRHGIPLGGVRPPLVAQDPPPLGVLSLLKEVIP